MIFELISVVVAGFVGAGLALILRRVFRRLPRWLTPVCIGAGMLIVTLANEYGWYGRQVAGLPETAEVAEIHEVRSRIRPWTLIRPFSNRFITVDHTSRQTHTVRPELRMVDLFLFARWQPVTMVQAVFDCANGRRIDLREGVQFGADGSVTGANWIETGMEDPVTATACKED